ncbi:unnamed protein product [Polarella glacialis]|uniref:Uncharacterized protein n=1 Tax=Polarella glacialis TaxID=89957 RepID=A0A813IFL1_POLGL|nr:unnamed protein product [Polarella glacialis]
MHPLSSPCLLPESFAPSICVPTLSMLSKSDIPINPSFAGSCGWSSRGCSHRTVLVVLILWVAFYCNIGGSSGPEARASVDFRHLYLANCGSGRGDSEEASLPR